METNTGLVKQEGRPGARSRPPPVNISFQGQANYLPARKIREVYDVHSNTLAKWAEAGKIRHVKTPGGRRLLCAQDVDAVFAAKGGTGPKAPKAAPAKKSVIYARVSSAKQRDAGDLQRQVDALTAEYPDHDVVTDVASGLSWKRTGLLSILDAVHAGRVEQVVVAHKDRLARFSVELIQWIFKKHGVRLVVHDHKQDFATAEQELAEDLISVTNVFVARHNGRRSGIHRQERAAKRRRTEAGGDAAGGGDRDAEEVSGGTAAADHSPEAPAPPVDGSSA